MPKYTTYSSPISLWIRNGIATIHLEDISEKVARLGGNLYIGSTSTPIVQGDYSPISWAKIIDLANKITTSGYTGWFQSDTDPDKLIEAHNLDIKNIKKVTFYAGLVDKKSPTHVRYAMGISGFIRNPNSPKEPNHA